MSEVIENRVDTINAYYDGLREGVYMYAYMQDGVYYVGTTGRTLKEAYTAIEDERNRVLGRHHVQRTV